jgi:radical SAM protein with 4Fe4S-binding SPASM domain
VPGATPQFYYELVALAMMLSVDKSTNSQVRSTTKLRQCSACKKVYYCSAECQKAHWKVHKADCKKEQALQTLAALAKT